MVSPLLNNDVYFGNLMLIRSIALCLERNLQRNLGPIHIEMVCESLNNVVLIQLNQFFHQNASFSKYKRREPTFP